MATIVHELTLVVTPTSPSTAKLAWQYGRYEHEDKNPPGVRDTHEDIVFRPDQPGYCQHSDETEGLMARSVPRTCDFGALTAYPDSVGA
jgi:hypothetical protein